MHSSSNIGKPQIFDWLKEIGGSKINKVLDIGAGCGTYYDLFVKEHNFLTHSEWHGVEISDQCINDYKLREKYNHVYSTDCRMIDWNKIPQVDVAFLGDVVHLMPVEDAIDLIDNVRIKSKITIVTLPIRKWPLPYNDEFRIERAREGWTDVDFMLCFTHHIAKKHQFNNEIGVYLMGEWYDGEVNPDHI